MLQGQVREELSLQDSSDAISAEMRLPNRCPWRAVWDQGK